MATPDQRLFEEDLLTAEFRIGVANGFWGVLAQDPQPQFVWPKAIFWIAAPPRPNAPDRFHVVLDLTGYRTVPPTGSFWDPVARAALPTARWPKGKRDTRFAKVFRTDWQNAVAFYHPFDRVAAQSHPEWAAQQPHLVWNNSRTIVDYLEEFHSLLSGEDYTGV